MGFDRVLILEGLRRYTVLYGGLVFLEATEEVSSAQSFAYNYIPIIVALILVTLWSLVDFDVLRLEPYFQLARPEGVPASVVFICSLEITVTSRSSKSVLCRAGRNMRMRTVTIDTNRATQ